jgi:DNA ligase-1
MPKFQPMKGSVAPADLTQLRYPLLASEKLDGWRAVVAPIEWARANIPCEPKHREYFDSARWTIALSASNKPISNLYVQRQLDTPILAWCDGELIASEHFNETSSAFASYNGEPAFAFHIFDLFDEPAEPFAWRLARLKDKQIWSRDITNDNVELYKHPHVEISDAAHLQEYIEERLPPNAEGAVTRCPFGQYKFGRATEKQGWMLKIKPFVDAEAVVIGVEELMHNMNDPQVTQVGLYKRSQHKDGKVPGDKLGALVCRGLGEGSQPLFKIGTGFDDATRRLLWAQRGSLIGRIVVYKSMKAGALNAPRHPVFKGFRHEDHSG